MKTIKVERVLRLNPCYPSERIHEIASRREAWTLADILDQSDLPAADRIWVVVRLMPPAGARAFARWCALQVVHLWDCPDVVRGWLEAGDESIRSAARAATSHAAYAAVAAAYAATSHAAYADAAAAYAAYAATSHAADAATSHAAYAAVAADAYAAARDAQIAKLKEMCNI